MTKRRQMKMTKSEVVDLLLECSIVRDRYEIGMDRHGTLTAIVPGGGIVAFATPERFYDRNEVNRFIGDFRMTVQS